jgi:hypothetical protein
MPPASSAKAAWKVEDFGALQKGSVPRVAAPQAPAPNPHVAKPPFTKPPFARPNAPVNVPRPGGHGKPSHARPNSPPLTPPDIEPEEEAPARPGAEVPLRVPFGRGPKDKAFVQEREAKVQERRHRHKKGKR